MVLTFCLDNMTSYHLFRLAGVLYCFQQSPDILRQCVDYDGFSTLLQIIVSPTRSGDTMDSSSLSSAPSSASAEISC